MIKRTIGLLLVAGAIVGGGFGVSRGIRAVVEATADAGDGDVPTTTVRRGHVAITVPTRGDLQGGRAAPLIVPPTGATELPIIFLRDMGELVEAGDIVVEFDSSGQDYDLVEAEADLLEAEQQLVQAEAEARVALEDARLAVVTAEADLRIAELELPKGEVLSSIQQRQNEIAFQRAQNRYEQAVLDLEHDEATTDSGLDVQRAAVTEALTKAETARRIMADLTLRAPSAGYVQLAENTSGVSSLYLGMQIPTFQLGDVARSGQMIGRIPDMSRWEINTQIPETDRAFLEVGQEAIVRPKAMPGREFRGHISLLGGSSGNAWNRTFNCVVDLDDTDPGLRPGMSVDIIINVETLEDVLYIPSQAVFEREGRWFVYRQVPEGFITADVTLVRRTESQAVITGIEEGVTIALAPPGQENQTSPGSEPRPAALPSRPGVLPQ